MLVPVLVFLGGLSVGALSGARWLPELASGQVGGIAFFVVCGLIGATIGLLGVHIYLIVSELDHLAGPVTQGEVVGDGMRNIAVECGWLIGLTAVVYLLAPTPEEAKTPAGIDPE